MMLPLSFNMKARAFNGSYHKTPMPITFGEVYNFYPCLAPSVDAQAVDMASSVGERKTSKVASVSVSVVSGETKVSSAKRKLCIRLRPAATVLLSSEEEKAAFEEAAL